jgi:hypothetical protein
MSIIIAGCGGGYDIFGGIPLYLEQKELKKNIVTINLSFTNQKKLSTLSNLNQVKKINDKCYLINHKNIKEKIDYYFPEYYFSKHLDCEIYVLIVDSTIQEIINSYNTILDLYKDVYKIYLVDGGCDVLLKGDESGLATPVEDMMHLYAVQTLYINEKYICAIGMNVDTFTEKEKDNADDDPTEIELIKRLEYLEKNNILLKKYLWNIKDDKVKKYYDMVINSNPINTIVHSFICSSLENKTGVYIPEYIKKRVNKSHINLGELTKTFVICDLDMLYKDNLYIDSILQIEDDRDIVDQKIDNFRKKNKKII